MSKQISKQNNKNSKTKSQRAYDQLIPAKMGRLLAPIRGPITPSRELHYTDLTKRTAAMDTTGSVTLLNAIAEGTETNQRLGREASIQDVSVRMNVFLPVGTTAAVPSQLVRAMLVWDNAVNSTQALVTDILTVSSPYGFPLVDNISRFTIIAERSVVLGNNVGPSDKTCAYIEFDVPIRSSTRWNGTGAPPSNIQNGALYLLTIGETAAGTTAASSSFSSRTTFYDVL
jgi:hypothetical protein